MHIKKFFNNLLYKRFKEKPKELLFNKREVFLTFSNNFTTTNI